MTRTLDHAQTGPRFPGDAAITVTDLPRVYRSGRKVHTAVEKSTFHVNRGEVLDLAGGGGPTGSR